MVFTQDFEAFGNKLKVRMLSAKEAMELGDNVGENATFELVQKITLDEKGKPLFATIDEVKTSLPPKVIEDIITLSVGGDIKKK